jgi:coenzyme F420-0:L-glutamate ligase/coenzyme F420-1:gamma-L-glutamate ligase
MAAPKELNLSVVPGIPLIEAGDDLGAIVIAAVERAGIGIRDGDVVVVAQKVVSKAHGRYVDLADVTPSQRAVELASRVGKDARLVEVILSESVRVVRGRPGLLIVEHRLGFVAANAGVDRSNVGAFVGREMVLLLPEAPDTAARELRTQWERHFKKSLGVIVSDSFGRPWRQGTVGVALGAAGIPALNDLRGRPDLFGRKLEVSETAVADEVASAASLLMGQADEAYPVVVVSGFGPYGGEVPASALIRPAAKDLFR